MAEREARAARYNDVIERVQKLFFTRGKARVDFIFVRNHAEACGSQTKFRIESVRSHRRLFAKERKGSIWTNCEQHVSGDEEYEGSDDVIIPFGRGFW